MDRNPLERSYFPHDFFRFQRLLMRFAPDYRDLNRSQKRTLMFLKHRGGQPMTVIVNHMNIEKGSMTSVVDSLIAKGLVRRERDKEDRRRVIVSLSDEGAEAAVELEALLDDYVTRRIDQLGEENKRKLEEVMAMVRSCTEIWEEIDGTRS